MATQTLKAADLIALFNSWKMLFAEQRDYLIALDGKVGDSDLGITMSKSFQLLRRRWKRKVGGRYR